MKDTLPFICRAPAVFMAKTPPFCCAFAVFVAKMLPFPAPPRLRTGLQIDNALQVFADSCSRDYPLGMQL